MHHPLTLPGADLNPSPQRTRRPQPLPARTAKSVARKSNWWSWVLALLVGAVLLAGVRHVQASAVSTGSFRRMTATREAQQKVDDALNAAIAKAGDRRMIENLGVQVAMQILGTATDLSGETTVPSTLFETFIEGDTWRSFASRYGLTTEALARLNPGVSRNHVNDGAELVIYKFDSERRSRSNGRASGGSLTNGVPMGSSGGSESARPPSAPRPPSTSWSRPSPTLATHSPAAPASSSATSAGRRVARSRPTSVTSPAGMSIWATTSAA